MTIVQHVVEMVSYSAATGVPTLFISHAWIHR